MSPEVTRRPLSTIHKSTRGEGFGPAWDNVRAGCYSPCPGRRFRLP